MLLTLLSPLINERSLHCQLNLATSLILVAVDTILAFQFWDEQISFTTLELTNPRLLTTWFKFQLLRCINCESSSKVPTLLLPLQPTNLHGNNCCTSESATNHVTSFRVCQRLASVCALFSSHTESKTIVTWPLCIPW